MLNRCWPTSISLIHPLYFVIPYSLPSVPLFLELVKQLLDPAKYKELGAAVQAFPRELASKLVPKGAFENIGRHILSYVRDSRGPG